MSASGDVPGSGDSAGAASADAAERDATDWDDADSVRASSQKLRGVGADEVEKTIDAVTGATWGTRNRIMAGLFQRDMRRHADEMPAFAPPGEDVGLRSGS